MYIIIYKESQKAIVLAQKIDVANILGVHRNTINNKFKTTKVWEREKETVYEAHKFYPSTKSGNTDDARTRHLKAIGELEYEYNKKKK